MRVAGWGAGHLRISRIAEFSVQNILPDRYAVWFAFSAAGE